MADNLGSQAEQYALAFLQQQGLKLIEKNFRGRFGEIDLIMRHHDVLVFVEVRLRKPNAFGGAEASITSSKQKKLILTASQYMQRHGEQPCRFDTVLLSALQADSIIWYQQAFQLDHLP